MSIKRAAVTGAVLLSIATVAGCGGDGKESKAAATGSATTSPDLDRLESATGTTIVEKARGELMKAKSVKITGTESDGAEKASFEVSATPNGDCTGFIGQSGEGKVGLLRISGQTLIKNDAKLLSKFGEVAEPLRSRWVRVKSQDILDGVSGICDFKRLPVFGDGTKPGEAGNDGAKTVNGQKVVGLFVASKQDGAYKGYVATEGARPVRIESFQSEDGKRELAMDFSDYDAPVTIAAPPADQIVDEDELKKTAPAS
ncbi:hypothetical protein [Kitasatospora sp. NPDC097643]|uniref:hypothetical protein n=1 Tax=Kitasatospora sp. NPDC097643 TaxID=3157230 RepID=UPI00333335AF